MTIIDNDQSTPAEDDRPRSGGGRKARNRNRNRNRNNGRHTGAKTPSKTVDEIDKMEVEEVESTDEAEPTAETDAVEETEQTVEADTVEDPKDEVEDPKDEVEDPKDEVEGPKDEVEDPNDQVEDPATAADKAAAAPEPEVEKETETKPVGAVAPKLASLPSANEATDSAWTMSDVLQVAQRALAVLAVLGLVGYGLGFSRGGTSVARTEFFYTLDESVPDSFLREDRRLLTQVVTFTSDAVLAPVADRFDTDVDDLRSRVEVETLELSEVLRLQVADTDADEALAISAAIIERYLDVTLAAQPAGENVDLAASRQAVAEELAIADAARFELDGRLADLDVRQASIERRIALESDAVERTRELLADAAARQVDNLALVAELDAGTDRLDQLELDLTAVAGERSLAIATAGDDLDSLSTGGGQSALLREIQRLEAKLATVEAELAERELAPLVASPIRVLDEPIVIDRSAHLGGLQGMALGLLVATPIAALVAFRTRQRQLWFG